MADDAAPPLLSLKVMRVSRPQLAAAWYPFYSSSPALSAHSTATVASLQGKVPLPGIPKTLRDLSHPTDLLNLPSSFGTIQLGETFSSCLCINNEAETVIEGVHLTVEIQTANTKVLLAEFGSLNHQLQPRDTMECLVTHEIKELGQHVLACTVTYRLPSGSRPSIATRDASEDPSLQTFRKFYKFSVSNPLSVKTKVHAAVSPSALVSPTERDKVFLEVHIQNLTHDPLHFQKMQFECAEGWTVDDVNTTVTNDELQSLFSGPMALMQPQDVRQYIYILTPKNQSLIPITHAPGSVIPLGRLDISWRSSFGEPSRLLTSMLSRRIPLVSPPAQPPASAVPSYLKRTISSAPSRPQSPQASQSRPSSPVSYQARPQSPFQVFAPPLLLPPIPDVDVQLLSTEALLDRSIKIDESFVLPFNLIVSSSIPPDRIHQRRIVLLAVQHLQTPTMVSSLSTPVLAAHEMGGPSPRPTSSGFSTPSLLTGAPSFNYPLAHQKLLVVKSARSPQMVHDQDRPLKTGASSLATLPPPYFEGLDELKAHPSSLNATFLGPSVRILPPIELSPQPASPTTAVAVHRFDLPYLAVRKGFTTIGGLRVLLLEDSFLTEAPHQQQQQEAPAIVRGENTQLRRARTLKEWDVIAEVWVGS